MSRLFFIRFNSSIHFAHLFAHCCQPQHWYSIPCTLYIPGPSTIKWLPSLWSFRSHIGQHQPESIQVSSYYFRRLQLSTIFVLPRSYLIGAPNENYKLPHTGSIYRCEWTQQSDRSTCQRVNVRFGIVISIFAQNSLRYLSIRTF